MRHIFLAILFGIFCGFVSVFGIDIYIRTGTFWGFVPIILGFLVAFNFTMTATIPFGFIRTRNSPFVKNSHALSGWVVVTGGTIRVLGFGRKGGVGVMGPSDGSELRT